MILTPKAKEYGKRLQVISHMYINKWTKQWKADREDFDELMKMTYADARDLHVVGGYMIQGDFDRAYKLACKLDTAVRDVIPNSVWRYLEKFTIDQE